MSKKHKDKKHNPNHNPQGNWNGTAQHKEGCNCCKCKECGCHKQ